MQVVRGEGRVSVHFPNVEKEFKEIDDYAAEMDSKFPRDKPLDFDLFCQEILKIRVTSSGRRLMDTFARRIYSHRGLSVPFLSMLLEHGYDIKGYDYDGNNFLMDKAETQYIVAGDIHHGFSIDYIYEGNTEYLQAQLEVIEYLISSNLFDLNQANEVGEKLVHFISGAKQCNYILEKLLKDNLVNPNDIARPGLNLTAIDYANKTGNTEGLTIIKKYTNKTM